MSSTTTTDTLTRSLQKARTELSRMRVKAALVKLDAHDKKDDVLENLERAYEKAAAHARELQDATQEKAQALTDAAQSAWQAFHERYKAATGQAIDA